MWQTIIIPMLLGFAVFMSGMKLMELALHRMAGAYLETFLQRFTRTPLHGLFVGTVSTALLQSSTAVSVISIGMVNSGLLTFTRTIGIILGTNIGSVVTTELIGLNINRLAIPFIAFAFAAWLLTALLGEMGLIPSYNNKSWLQHIRSASVAIGGFGLLLAGLTMMQSTGGAVSDSGVFHWLLAQSETSLWWGLLAGTIMTALVHSSAAVIGIVMGFTMMGTMPVELGIAIVLGANIGTCATALLASIGGTKAGYYVALSHVILNVGGALLFMPFIDLLIQTSDWLSHTPSSHIARAQTIFNILSSLIALPLCYTKWLQKIDPAYS
ncbi:Na/Pi cotransporter family protein [Paenibacillus yanchengensis]|uniref:Na/Pi cotransporter family protein n=1 Tax=Paenibacillus yanchengensis TaxID=2035833 RepID=A0ABW4YL18_9BACL